MRWVICAGVLLALAPRAYAGDFDVLRGAEPAYHWGGFYGGAQGGFSSSDVNFGPSVGPDVAFILRNTSIENDQNISGWTVLGSRYPEASSFGGFIGYNVEWQNLILGGELNYNHVFLSAASSGSITRDFTDSGNLPAGHHYFYNLTVTGTAAMSMTDIATFRARAGYQAGQFLPYGFAGLAVGKMSTSSGATVAYSAVDYPDSETPPLTPLCNINVPSVTNCNISVPTQSQTNSVGQTFAYGFATGFGVDAAILPNLFVRGEYEFIYFAPIDGVQLNMQNVRVGVGVKF
jgi:outer membrane immunogenic protein